MNSLAEANLILHDIRREIEHDPESARAAVMRLATLLSQPMIKPVVARGGLAPWQKRKIEQYLRDRVPEQVRLDELAQQISLSVSYFCRAFKETFGVTPHNYLVRLRLQLAQELMLQSDGELSQISLACGFSDQSHLCKAFRRELGETPGSWRRRNLTDMPVANSQPCAPRISMSSALAN